MIILKKFYKRKILLLLTTVIILTTLLSNLSSFFIHQQKLSSIQVNQENIYPEELRLSLQLENKNQNKVIKNQLKTKEQKNAYKKNLMQQVISKKINESLFKQYIDKINFSIPQKYAKKQILLSKYFQVKNNFNYPKYLSFIRSAHYTNIQYLSKIQNKISIRYLIQILLKSIIILKNEIKHQFKRIINRKNFQILTLKLPMRVKENKINHSKIKKYFHENKEKFYTPESVKIDIIRLKRQLFPTNNWNQTNIEKYYFNKFKKNIKHTLYKYLFLQTNSLQLAKIFEKNCSKKGFFKNIEQNIKNKNNKQFRLISLGWKDKKNTPLFIKQCKLKEKGDCSKIIYYKNNFFIIFLTDIIQPYKDTIDTVQNKKIEKIKTKNIPIKRIICDPKISYLMDRKKQKSDTTFIHPKYNIQYTTPYLNCNNVGHYSRSREFNQFIKKNFFNPHCVNNSSTVRMYMNKKKHIYLLKIHSYIPKQLQEKSKIYQEIAQILTYKKQCNKNDINIRNFLLTKKKEKQKYLSKHPVYSSRTYTQNTQDNGEIIKIINKLPKLKNNKYIYFLLPKINEPAKLIVYKKMFFKKYSVNEKYNLIQQIKQYLKIKIIVKILENLYKKSKIIYNSDTNNL